MLLAKPRPQPPPWPGWRRLHFPAGPTCLWPLSASAVATPRGTRRRLVLLASYSASSPSPSPEEKDAVFSSEKPMAAKKRTTWKNMVSLVPTKLRSMVLLNAVTLVYASSICVVKEAEAAVGIAAFNAVRFSILAIPFIPFLSKIPKDSQIISAGVELGIWVSLAYLSQAIGLLTAGANRTAFISSLTVVIVPLIDGILGAAVPAYTWFGAFLSLAGVTMLELSGSRPCIGDILNLLSAICFAIHMLKTEHISRIVKNKDYLSLMGCQVLVVALSSALWFVLRDIPGCVKTCIIRQFSWTNICDGLVSFPWMAALYTGIFSTGLCLWAEPVVS